ncbi:unnamed protein product [Echinostoma caproni]|uniref:SNF2 N-terminal domain-containing protein n=1 Tax=Echinostoma caproni TaxID=27848 RepID=A0A3P8IST3_9TREM|nr:unnamed protein product [Echinostoma caproni]
MRHAFLRTVPGLILSPNCISGDAELVVAAHLGQLTVIDQESQAYCRPTSLSGSNISGNWGPHLIVTSRLSLPSWRTRLLTWCPGLKVVCLCLDVAGEPSGKSRRLRACVARGAVNICLTTYSALRARPSRYSQIQWSVIVFDQVHNLVHHLGGAGSNREINGYRSQTTMKPGCTGGPQPGGDLSSLSTDVTGSGEVKSSCSRHNAANSLDLFTSVLSCTGHRLLISSVPDLCHSLCGYRLYLLSRLLLLKDPVGSPTYESWVSELFKASAASQKRRTSQSSGSERPTKRQLIKFMEPFIVRLDEDDEWETLVCEEIVPCPMTTTQCELHDAVLATKT